MRFKYALVIKHGYTETTFHFKKILEAEAFLATFIKAKQPDEESKYAGDRKWEYKIIPVFDEKEEEKQDE